MQGRIDNKRKIEVKLQNQISDMPEFINEYYYSLRSYSHTTKLRYIENTLRFLNYMYGDKLNKNFKVDEIKNITSNTIQRYIDNINYYENEDTVKELKTSSIGCIASSLSSFFSFLLEENYIEKNPFANKAIKRGKIQLNEIVFLTPEEVKSTENKIFEGAGTKLAKSRQEEWKYRDYLLFRIPSVTGLRVTALSEINVQDVDLKKKVIYVTEKGNVDKKIYLDDKTVEIMKKWIEKRKELLEGLKCDALFISNRRSRMTVRSIENIIKKYTEVVTDKHITPHKLRSTCATNLYQKEKDIYLVSKVLGHKSTAPTQRYTEVFESDKINAVNTMADLYN